MENVAKFLMVGGADIKHMLRTVAGSVDYKGKFVFKLCDPNPHVQARNWILLKLLLAHNPSWDPTAAFTMAFYSLHLDKATFDAVKNTISEAINSFSKTCAIISSNTFKMPFCF